MPGRAVLFVDGNNWYHSLGNAGVRDLGRIDYARISKKLVGPRTWIGTRYYIGRVQQRDSGKLYADQRRFLRRLESDDRRISVHLGRLERRVVRSEAASELRRCLAEIPVRINQDVFRDLMTIATRHERTGITVEKAVDVMLAVDMVKMAERDEIELNKTLADLGIDDWPDPLLESERQARRFRPILKHLPHAPVRIGNLMGHRQRAVIEPACGVGRPARRTRPWRRPGRNPPRSPGGRNSEAFGAR